MSLLSGLGLDPSAFHRGQDRAESRRLARERSEMLAAQAANLDNSPPAFTKAPQGGWPADTSVVPVGSPPGVTPPATGVKTYPYNPGPVPQATLLDGKPVPEGGTPELNIGTGVGVKGRTYSYTYPTSPDDGTVENRDWANAKHFAPTEGNPRNQWNGGRGKEGDELGDELGDGLGGESTAGTLELPASVVDPKVSNNLSFADSTRYTDKRIASLLPLIRSSLDRPEVKELIELAIQMGVDPVMAVAISGIESTFGRNTSDSWAGAKGLMQVTAPTFRQQKVWWTDPAKIKRYNLPSFMVDIARGLDPDNKTALSNTQAGLLLLKHAELIGVDTNLLGAAFQGNASIVAKRGTPTKANDRQPGTTGIAHYNEDYNRMAVTVYNALWSMLNPEVAQAQPVAGLGTNSANPFGANSANPRAAWMHDGQGTPAVPGTGVASQQGQQPAVTPQQAVQGQQPAFNLPNVQNNYSAGVTPQGTPAVPGTPDVPGVSNSSGNPLPGGGGSNVSYPTGASGQSANIAGSAPNTPAAAPRPVTQPGGNNASVTRLMTSRERLVANIKEAGNRGLTDMVAQGFVLLGTVDTNLRNAVYLQAADDLTYGSVGRATRVFRHISGRQDAQIQPRGDGQYNIIIGGQIVKTMSVAQLQDYFYSKGSPAYAQDKQAQAEERRTADFKDRSAVTKQNSVNNGNYTNKQLESKSGVKFFATSKGDTLVAIGDKIYMREDVPSINVGGVKTEKTYTLRLIGASK